MIDLIRAKLKKIVELQDVIQKDDLNYKSKCRNTYNFGKYSLPITFLRENADLKQSNFVIELKNFEKDTKLLEKRYFFK